MSGSKETPRQKMIGMMYLVLTAMLALNVSTSILQSFVIVNQSMVETNANFAKKVESMHSLFDKGYLANREKMQENYDKSKLALQYSEEFRAFVIQQRNELVALTEGITVEVASKLDPSDFQRKDNYDTPSLYFINQGHGKELMSKIREYKDKMKALLPSDQHDGIDRMLNIDGPFKDNDGKSIDWVQHNFYQVVIVAAVTILNKIENDAMNIEYDVVSRLYSSVSAEDFKFDSIEARIVPKSNYVLLGETFEAEIFVAAFDSKSKITATIGGQTIPGDMGVVHLKRTASKEGTEVVKGTINVPTILGQKSYPFETEYTVARPSATVSADKMNVLYIGVDNPVSLSAAGMDVNSVTATISNGTITRVDGTSYNVRVNSGREAVISVVSKTDKNSRVMGSVTYRVKRVPDPIAMVNGIDEEVSKVDRDQLASAGGLRALIKDFDFDLKVAVSSFKMQMTRGGEITEAKSNSNRFTDEMENYIKGARKGTKVFFDDIVVKMPTGNISIRPIVYEIK